MMALAFTMTACATTTPPKSKAQPEHVDHSLRLERLIELTDYSERVYAYHEFCVTDGTPIDPRFEDNFKITVNLLFDEFIKSLRWDPAYAQSQIKERRKNLQNQLKAHYASSGCSSPEANEAKEYYRILSNQSRDSIEDYITGAKEKPAKASTSVPSYQSER